MAYLLVREWALSGQLNSQSYRVFVLLGAGQMTGGSVWEAALFSVHYKLSNFTAILIEIGLKLPIQRMS
ncbi:hypothetical protein [Candidatus Bartonella washoeensis]|uniref:Uncharacterized protein n=1 Tax=Cardidatus Bartonella washoeensis 085-0475 TaxID=1094564 RepID=J0QCN7_9HYPH|nr:hypothetical protein [Bartonella washoeensis]EJF83106.1 hypothetical protein MCW_01400 [Bartonella washoeensis 085-0475]